MATYGISIYGKSKYGTTVGVEYSVAPFTATQTDYGRLTLRWTNPTGTWRYFRLIKNYYGFPGYESDGEVLVDIDNNYTYPTGSYDDSDLIPGRYAYYGVYVGVQDGNAIDWKRAGFVTGLPVADYGFQDRLWSQLPEVMRLESVSSLTDGGDENAALKQFLSVFAYHFDMLRTEAETLLAFNDVHNVKYSIIESLASELNATFEPELSPRLNRRQVQYATYMHQKRGTTLGLEQLINTVTGWHADIAVGNNRMLDSDQSSFVHPTYDDWSPYTNYPAGQKVSYNSYVYVANAGGAFGTAQAPSGTNTNNTWWNVVQGTVDSTTLFNPDTGGQSSWGAINFNIAGHNADNAGIYLASGFQSPVYSSVNYSNSLVVKNTLGSTGDIGVRSVSPLTGQTTIDPEQVIEHGIPVLYDEQGDVFTASAYLAMGLGAVTAKMFIEWYDLYGSLITRIEQPSNPTVFDGFDKPGGGSLTSVTADSGQSWQATGTWTETGEYVYLNMATPGFYVAFIGTNRSDISAGVTVMRFATDGGLLLRYVDANDYILVGKNNVKQVISGASTTLGTYSTPFADGDRMTAQLIGANLTIYCNGVSCWTGTVTVASSHNHGIWAQI